MEFPAPIFYCAANRRESVKSIAKDMKKTFPLLFCPWVICRKPWEIKYPDVPGCCFVCSQGASQNASQNENVISYGAQHIWMLLAFF